MAGTCFKCGEVGYDQWKICSDETWRWVCLKCDLELNWIALSWAFPEDEALAKFEAYCDRLTGVDTDDGQ